MCSVWFFHVSRRYNCFNVVSWLFFQKKILTLTDTIEEFWPVLWEIIQQYCNCCSVRDDWYFRSLAIINYMMLFFQKKDRDTHWHHEKIKTCFSRRSLGQIKYSRSYEKSSYSTYCNYCSVRDDWFFHSKLQVHVATQADRSMSIRGNYDL